MKIGIDLKSGQIAQDTSQNNNNEVIVGIDLGTTNSLVAYVQNGSPVTVKGGNGHKALVPSIVYFSEEGDIIVGQKAKEYLTTSPERVVFSAKRLMGKAYNDIKDFLPNVGYEVVETDKESLVKIRVNNTFYSPIELSARILSSLKQDVERHLNKSVTKAVITVPAYFNDTQRQATRDAGKLAGLDVLRIINEPTAASLAYGIGTDPDTSANIAVYDLGGGTFDISILHLEDGIFDVLSTHGDTMLGGDDFDNAIVDYWVDQVRKTQDLHTLSKSTMQTLRLLAEMAKKSISSETIFEAESPIGHVSLTREVFQTLITPWVERTIDACRLAVSDAKLEPKDIDRVILVGGSTRIPLIKSRLAHFFGQKPYDDINPDEAVALGAAIQADILAGNRQDILLLDVTPLSLGIETVGGLMDVIIPRNTKVPHRAGRQYTTSIDGQKNILISVYQGERDLVAHNRKLGAFTLKDIPPMVAGMPKIDVHFILDADGILRVKAKELRSGLATQVDIKSTYGISEEEMAKMLLDSITHAKDDMQAKALVDSINEGKNMIQASEKFVRQNETWMNKTDVDRIIELTQILSSAISSSDKATIDTAMQDLNAFATPLAHQALDHHIGKSLTGTTLDD